MSIISFVVTFILPPLTNAANDTNNTQSPTLGVSFPTSFPSPFPTEDPCGYCDALKSVCDKDCTTIINPTRRPTTDNFTTFPPFPRITPIYYTSSPTFTSYFGDQQFYHIIVYVFLVIGVLSTCVLVLSFGRKNTQSFIFGFGYAPMLAIFYFLQGDFYSPEVRIVGYVAFCIPSLTFMIGSYRLLRSLIFWKIPEQFTNSLELLSEDSNAKDFPEEDANTADKRTTTCCGFLCNIFICIFGLVILILLVCLSMLGAIWKTLKYVMFALVIANFKLGVIPEVMEELWRTVGKEYDENEWVYAMNLCMHSQVLSSFILFVTAVVNTILVKSSNVGLLISLSFSSLGLFVYFTIPFVNLIFRDGFREGMYIDNYEFLEQQSKSFDARIKSYLSTLKGDDAVKTAKAKSAPPPKLPLVAGKKFHIFASHAWGTNQSNHKRVAKFVQELEKLGLCVWFDSEKLSGAIHRKITNGLKDSCVFLIFITKDYLEKIETAETKRGTDWCNFEFTASLQFHGIGWTIITVNENNLLNPTTWSDTVRSSFGSLLTIDFSTDDLLHSAAKNVYDEVARKLNLSLPEQDINKEVDPSLLSHSQEIIAVVTDDQTIPELDIQHQQSKTNKMINITPTSYEQNSIQSNNNSTHKPASQMSMSTNQINNNNPFVTFMIQEDYDIL
jgi:hypothetical protein